jgi:RNA polymerase sigma factor (sigma-70 family)
MVQGVCRRLLRNPADADDAFQAAFLAPARAGRSIGRRSAVAAWLYRVAYRAALRLRAENARRPASGLVGIEPAAPACGDDVLWRDLRPVLDAEISGLPGKLRSAFLLCQLEGHTNEEAARELGCPAGTVLSRLSRARERLRARLTRRGLAPAVAAGGAALSIADLSAATAPVPTMEALCPFATDRPTITDAMPPRAAALAQGVLTAMWMQRIRIAVGLVLTLAILGTGAGLVGLQAPARDPPGKEDKSAPVMVAKAAPVPEEPLRIAELAKARLAAAREVYECMMMTYRAGCGSMDDIFHWWLHMLEAQLDAATTKAERVQAREEYLARAVEYEKNMKDRWKGGRAGPQDLAEAKMFRLEAELRLAREKAR